MPNRCPRNLVGGCCTNRYTFHLLLIIPLNVYALAENNLLELMFRESTIKKLRYNTHQMIYFMTNNPCNLGYMPYVVYTLHEKRNTYLHHDGDPDSYLTLSFLGDGI